MRSRIPERQSGGSCLLSGWRISASSLIRTEIEVSKTWPAIPTRMQVRRA